jgi:hypothetical protein
MKIYNAHHQWWNIFRYSGSNFHNIHNKKVLDVYQGKDAEGQKVILWKRHNRANQRWSVVYQDKHSKIRGKGYNNQFGFHIMRPFVMRSRLGVRRVVECVSNAYVRSRKYYHNRKAQHWVFDNKSKTVQSYYWRNRAVEITSNGNSA